jgi:phytoene dehydrogenase-like protein
MAEIPAGRLASAARALMMAGRWAQAADLLAAATPGEGEQPALILAAAEVAVDQDFWTRTNGGASAVSRLSPGYEADALRLRHDYFAVLCPPGSAMPVFGPEGRDPAVLDGLASRAARLAEEAPDAAHAASAMFFIGLIADNLRGDEQEGRAAFAKAADMAKEAGDDLTESEALRHLGYHTSVAGDTELARQQWDRSLRLRQRAGCVPYVLSQQLLLAGLAKDTGDAETARALASQVRSWSHDLGATLLEKSADSLLTS